MSENNNAMVVNEENKFMNVCKRIPIIPFLSKQKKSESNTMKKI